MLIKLLVLAAVVAAAVFWVSPAARASIRPHLPRLILIGALVVIALLVATGRLSWIGAAIAATAAAIQRFLPTAMRLAPLLRFLGSRTAPAGGSAGTPPPSGGDDGPMTRARALAVLGLENEPDPPDRETVLAAHRRLIQHCHPDRGGSGYLAAQLNEARDCLLGDDRAA
ncbi:hypothetical protein KBTX_04118 [wastewater metagenome]|uniref:J domain-containing protein n=2 Tax=unclassified sequences TaxID=12908 RepID=A0A5B8RKJ8_9ZZZZ|nr:hypothetical protein [Arhodomonas sp. KWT]QEA07755.1 hypothetical protein KBTEX_04118 [uncultured organism]